MTDMFKLSTNRPKVKHCNRHASTRGAESERQSDWRSQRTYTETPKYVGSLVTPNEYISLRMTDCGHSEGIHSLKEKFRSPYIHEGSMQMSVARK